MTIKQIVSGIESGGLLPVVRAPSAEKAVALALALHKGGITCLEITLTVPGATDVIRQLTEKLGDTALVGAGTVLTRDDAIACLDAGSRFLVSPGHVEGMIQLAHDRDAAAMPGALTPSEVIATWQGGADFVKVFPCSALGGASYLKALKAPLPNVKLLPTGGVSVKTIPEYLDAGAAALGVGAALADPGLLDKEGADAISQLAKTYMDAFRAAKKH